MPVDHAAWAAYLLAGVDERRPLQAITKQLDQLGIDDAYAIQAALLELQLGRGDTLAGAKLGLTSVAKQQQMGVAEPVYGWVTGSSVLGAGERVASPELQFEQRGLDRVCIVDAEDIDLFGDRLQLSALVDAGQQIGSPRRVVDGHQCASSFARAASASM